MPVVHLVGEIPDLVIQVAKAIKGQSACLKPVLATVFLDVPGNTMACGINVHKTGNYSQLPESQDAFRKLFYLGHLFDAFLTRIEYSFTIQPKRRMK
jgi:hypothetical protein